MTNSVECRAGTGELAAKLADENLEFYGVKIVGADPSKEIGILRNTLRGHFMKSIALDSEQEETVTLADLDCQRMAGLFCLQSLALQRFDCPAGSIRLFTNLTHLAIDSATDDQIMAIGTLTKLASLHLKSALEERHIRCFINLKSLTELIAPFRFPEPDRATLTVAQYLPALQRVETLPCSTPLTPQRVQQLSKAFEFKTNFLLKRVFALQDTKGHDLFHHCREALVGENPNCFEFVMRYINNETTSEEQLLEWLDYSLTSPLLKVFDRVLDCQVDVNRPLSDNDRALVVAVQGDSISRSRIFEYVVVKLLAKGANPSFCDGFGCNPLIFATKELRSNLVKILLSTSSGLNPMLINTVLELAISSSIEQCRQDKEKAAHAYNIVIAVCAKRPGEKCLTEQLERILKCKVPVPIAVVETLLKAGAKSNEKNSEGNTALNGLLHAIHSLDKAKSQDNDLWEAKFGYFKVIIENGDNRITNYQPFLDIARCYGAMGVLPFLEHKLATQPANKSAAKKSAAKK